jgi:hypothetical protein
MLTAGLYWIGDLCYVFDEDDWSEICGLMYDTDNDGFIEYNGIKMFWANTAYGDGTYYDQYGNEYPVDAGLIGAVALKNLTSEKAKKAIEDKYGQLIEFERSFTCSEDDGIIMIGKYIINTGDTEEYEDDDWNDDWNDEEEDN